MDDESKAQLDKAYKEDLAKAKAEIRQQEINKLTKTGGSMSKDEFDRKVEENTAKEVQDQQLEDKYEDFHYSEFGGREEVERQNREWKEQQDEQARIQDEQDEQKKRAAEIQDQQNPIKDSKEQNEPIKDPVKKDEIIKPSEVDEREKANRQKAIEDKKREADQAAAKETARQRKEAYKKSLKEDFLRNQPSQSKSLDKTISTQKVEQQAETSFERKAAYKEQFKQDFERSSQPEKTQDREGR
jgi:hypothetical protein